MELVRCQVGKNVLTLSKAVEVNVSKRVINLFKISNNNVKVSEHLIEDSDKFSSKGAI